MSLFGRSSRKGNGRLLLIGFGDIQHSLGTRVYLLSLIEVMRQAGSEVQAFFLQAILPESLMAKVGSDVISIIPPPSGGCAKFLPKVLWRIYEMVWGIWYGLLVARKDGGRSETCILVGPGLLPLARVLRTKYRLVYILTGVAEEFLQSGRPRDRIKYVMSKTLERRFLPLFDYVVVVSAEMAEYCHREYGVERSLIVPCCVHLQYFQYDEGTRMETRRSLGIEDRFVFVYSGGGAPWQCVSETIRFYKLARASAPNAFFLVLSADAESWHQALRSLDPQTYRVITVSHAEVPRYLCAADAAFLLRKRSIINTVSAPVKFAEYLACGLPVITSPFVGDYSSMADAREVGVLIDPDDESTWSAALCQLMTMAKNSQTRPRCRRAAETLSWESVAPRLQAILQK